MYKSCCEELDVTPAECMVWMPAHKTRGQAQRLTLSDGTALTETHSDANDRAEKLAKAVVETHRVGDDVVEMWVQC